MSKYYLVGLNPFNGKRATALHNNYGEIQYFDSFLDACKSANELTEMKVMSAIRVVKLSPRTMMT